MRDVLRVAVLGDLHGAFDAIDAAQLDACKLDRIIFVGDLGPGPRDAGRRVARAIARLRTPVLVMPGNNDCEDAPVLRAELGHQRGLASLLKRSGAAHRSPLLDASADVSWCGYGLHALPVGAGVTVVSGRPYSMGGGELSFADALRERHGVRSLRDSIDRLVGLVDAVETRAVVFLSHNGPTGLGAERDAPWGCDFREGFGDHGDPDLRVAIDRAHERGLAVLAVIAGHMHHALRGGGTRRWCERRGETLYVNPARVPRVVAGRDGMARHHVLLRVTDASVEAEEICLASEE